MKQRAASAAVAQLCLVRRIPLMPEPMTEKQRQRWIALRAHGWSWFVFVYGLLRYGLPFGIFVFVGDRFLGIPSQHPRAQLILLAITSILFGVACAARRWRREEHRFHIDTGGASSALCAMLNYMVSLVIVGVIGMFALVLSIFGAWMTTTPLTAKQLHVEQIEIYVLFGLFLAALITSGAIAIRLLRFRNAQRSSQITSTV